MKTLTTQAEVQLNGHLVLDIPCDFPPGKIDVVLVMETPVQKSAAPPYPSQRGILAGRFPENLDVEAALREIKAASQTAMLELPQ